MSKKRITRHSPAAAAKMIDWSRSDAMTDEDIRAAVEDDPDAAPIADPAWFEKARLAERSAKVSVTIRLDRDVVDFFKRTRPQYQTAINAVLRAFVDHERERSRR